MKPLPGIYIHIPFCERKCVYCDFYSIENHAGIPGFIDALIKEFELRRNYIPEETAETIYIGGGTPSILSPENLERILGNLKTRFAVHQNAEITLEANPGTVSLQALKEYRRFGINRLSIGIQSLIDKELRFLSRIHTAEDACRTFVYAREAGFSNISIDLIYALPGQSLKSWHETLERSVALDPEHISAYNLTIENETLLGKQVKSGILTPVADDEEALLFTQTMEFLRSKGFVHYEVSNYSKPGYHSRHNMNYWNHTGYLGFGPSAHSFSGKKRWWNVSDVERYVRSLHGGALPVEGSEELSARQLLDEKIMLGLRTGALNINGLVPWEADAPREKLQSYLEHLTAEKLARIENNVIRVTDRGFLFCDEIAGRLSSCV